MLWNNIEFKTLSSDSQTIHSKSCLLLVVLLFSITHSGSNFFKLINIELHKFGLRVGSAWACVFHGSREESLRTMHAHCTCFWCPNWLRCYTDKWSEISSHNIFLLWNFKCYYYLVTKYMLYCSFIVVVVQLSFQCLNHPLLYFPFIILPSILLYKLILSFTSEYLIILEIGLSDSELCNVDISLYYGMAMAYLLK